MSNSINSIEYCYLLIPLIAAWALSLLTDIFVTIGDWSNVITDVYADCMTNHLGDRHNVFYGYRLAAGTGAVMWLHHDDDPLFRVSGYCLHLCRGLMGLDKSKVKAR